MSPRDDRSAVLAELRVVMAVGVRVGSTDHGFRDHDGPSVRNGAGGLIYMQGAVNRAVSYLRVVPHRVERMKQAVEEANR